MRTQRTQRTLRMLAALPAMAALCAGALAAPLIRPFHSDGMERILASKAGRPFLLLVWSLDCSYCHASMANLASAKNRAAFDVVTLAIESADEDGNAAAITSATSQLGRLSAVWAFGNEPPERLRYQLDPKWHGELPRSYWYDANGRRLVTHSGLLTPQLIVEFGNTIRKGSSPSK